MWSTYDRVWSQLSCSAIVTKNIQQNTWNPTMSVEKRLGDFLKIKYTICPRVQSCQPPLNNCTSKQIIIKYILWHWSKTRTLQRALSFIQKRYFEVNVDIYIYIYAFSRHFYPKRLTLHSKLQFLHFYQLCFPWESNPWSGIASAMLYYLSYRKAWNMKLFIYLVNCRNTWIIEQLFDILNVYIFNFYYLFIF